MELLTKFGREIRVVILLALSWAFYMTSQAALDSYEHAQCISARSYVQAFELCTQAGSASAYCQVGVDTILEFREARYHLATETCIRYIGG